MASKQKATSSGGLHAPDQTQVTTRNARAENNNSKNVDHLSLDKEIRDEKTAVGPHKFQTIKPHL